MLLYLYRQGDTLRERITMWRLCDVWFKNVREDSFAEIAVGLLGVTLVIIGFLVLVGLGALVIKLIGEVI